MAARLLNFCWHTHFVRRDVRGYKYGGIYGNYNKNRSMSAGKLKQALIDEFVLQLPYVPPYLYPQSLIIVNILESQKCALLLDVPIVMCFKMA
jgi:hypothetical protein